MTEQELKTKMRPIYDAIEQTFITRHRGATPFAKPGSKRYLELRAEFFTGAMAALLAMLDQEDLDKITVNGYAMPAFWVLSIISGRDLKCEEDI